MGMWKIGKNFNSNVMYFHPTKTLKSVNRFSLTAQQSQINGMLPHTYTRE